MAKTAYAFNEQDAKLILRTARRSQLRSELRRHVEPGIQRPHARITVAWVGSTAITARSGTPPSTVTPGSGTATLYTLEPGASTLTPWTDSNGDNVTITVYNAFGSATSDNVFIGVCQDMRGTWWVFSEDCG